jgi:hypothetical protein
MEVSPSCPLSWLTLLALICSCTFAFGMWTFLFILSFNLHVRSLSGGDDGLHGNQTIMEAAFESGDADWEITRYAGLGHGYTAPGSPDYSITGDVRSWESMLTAFEDVMAIPQKVAATPSPEASTSDVPSSAPVGVETSESTIPSPAPVGVETSEPTIPSPAPVGEETSEPTMIDSGVSCIGIWKAVVVAVAAAALV